MLHRCRHIIRSIASRGDFDYLVGGIHSDSYIGTPNMDLARKEFRVATNQRTYMR